jgi:hypothetical protein
MPADFSQRVSGNAKVEYVKVSPHESFSSGFRYILKDFHRIVPNNLKVGISIRNPKMVKVIWFIL